MMTKFSKTMHGCVTAAVMALSVPAMTGEKSQVVSYGDLDLSSTVGQINALAGCDLLTISPELLATLAGSKAPLVRSLDADTAQLQVANGRR